MTIEQFLRILMRRWLLIVVCFLLVGAGAFIGSKLTKPLYKSSVLVHVVVNSSQSTFDNLQASDDLVQTESTLATSSPVLSEVASHYPGLTVGDLSGEVSSSPKTSTQIFEIDVTDPSPDRAARLANDIAATLIKQQLQAIQQSNAQAQQQIQQNLNNISQQISNTTTEITTLQAKPGHEGQIALLQTQLSGLQQSYNQWQTSLAQLELTESGNVSPMQIAQPAVPDNSPVKPTTLLNTGGGLAAGLLLGVLLALLYEGLDTRVHTAEELGLLLRWPVLATIWRTESSNPKDLINPLEKSANVEAYRILRNNIRFASIDKTLHTLVVTSAAPLEGKSVVAANLAIFMAKAGKSTLLIDADLRRPTLHSKFGLPAEKMGLSNAVFTFSQPDTTNSLSSSPMHQLNADASLAPFIHAVGIPNLMVMPSGPLPPKPSDLLDSKAMQNFFKILANCRAEIVILDSPPLLGLADTNILISKVEGTLLVVDINHANKKKLKQTQALLTQAKALVLGCVVNKQRRRSKDTSYAYANFSQINEPSSISSEQIRVKNKQHENGSSTSSPVSMESIAVVGEDR